MRIGFMDSGVGGLTVLGKAIRELPCAQFLYYADTGHAPYGTRSREQVLDMVHAIVEFLVDKGSDAIVLACNTATGIAVSSLRNRFALPVIGMEPAVKPAVENHCNHGKDAVLHKRILVLATPLTLQQEKFRDLVDKVDTDHIVDVLPAPSLVEYAENGIFSGTEVEGYIRHLFEGRDMQRVSAVVLGCTHFLYFRDLLIRILPPGILLIDGNEGTVRRLVSVLTETYGTAKVASCKNAGNSSCIDFYDTGHVPMAALKQNSYLKLLDGSVQQVKGEMQI
ncbi:MAG TPA: glutamate racemase [Clostridiales bacterium]|nr:glutamate racemase [Clostridiales bacterium]